MSQTQRKALPLKKTGREGKFFARGRKQDSVSIFWDGAIALGNIEESKRISNARVALCNRPGQPRFYFPPGAPWNS
jgi:hypothetical protein